VVSDWLPVYRRGNGLKGDMTNDRLMELTGSIITLGHLIPTYYT
jgi:hypothetical protein